MRAYESFYKRFTKNNLKKIYEENVKFKSSVGNDKVTHKVFEARLDEEIDIIYRKVINNTYKFTTYRQKLISKGKTKTPREVSMCTIRDKITLVALKEVLTDIFEKEINTDIIHTYISSIKKSLGCEFYDTAIKLDMKNFYGTINHEKLLEILGQKIRKTELITLVSKAIKAGTSPLGVRSKIENEKGIPQGLPISNILSTIYLKDFDVEHNLNLDYRYFRYVDDILILCKEKDSQLIFEKIKSSLEGEYRLDVHPLSEKSKKSSITKIKEGFDYLGYTYKDKKFTVKDGSRERVEKRIEFLINEFKHKKYTKKTLKNRINIKITGFISEEKNKYGWLFFFSQLDDLTILYELDFFLEKVLKRNKISTKGIKKFTRTYHEILFKLDKTKYIPKFNKFTLEEKIVMLNNFFDIDYSKKTEKEIEYEFIKLQNQLKKDSERDMQNIS